MLFRSQRLERGLANVLTAAGLLTTRERAPARSHGDLAADVQRAVVTMQPRAEAAGIELATQLAAVPLVRDAEALQLVLHNLLDNAVKFSPRGSRVEVALHADDRDAVLSIRDRGTGMDPETLANAFTPFWRGTDGATGGTGLGLHLVRELVHAHGGTVAANSEGPGQGSEFTVRLPRRGVSA